MAPAPSDFERCHASFKRLKEALASVIVGQADVVNQVLWALTAGGHVLLEGAPGLGKTLLVRTLSECLDLRFSRIQFTPDLMPTDITGTNILVLERQATSAGRFELQRGPLFAELVLADEINRATPKTQSALLEAMQEQAVTIAGTRHSLGDPFMVLATENPIEMEGTYPLPEAQLDRFLLKVIVPAPDETELCEIVQRTTGLPAAPPTAVLAREDVLGLRRLCREVFVATPVIRYASKLVAATSPDSSAAPDLVRRGVRYGAGVRGAQALVLAAKAAALLEGRGQVALEDVQSVALPALRHRIIRSFEGEAEGITTDNVIREVLRTTPVRPEHVERALEES